MADIAPPPTYAVPVIVDPTTGRATFDPNWLKWFVDLAQTLNTAGGSSIGSVTSVALTAPTGFAVAGSPITTSGTLQLGFASGYSLPTDAEQSQWDTAYADRLKWDGGATDLNAATGRASLGATTVGENVFTITNPSAVTYFQVNADNTVSLLSGAALKTALGIVDSAIKIVYADEDLTIPTNIQITASRSLTFTGTGWLDIQGTGWLTIV